MENKTINMISGGRMGDFIHQLYVPKYIYEMLGIKTNLFISNHGDIFIKGVDEAHGELSKVISKQDYINAFLPYSNEHIDIDLSIWRNQNHYHVSWTKKLLSTYMNGEYPFIKNLKIVNHQKNLNEYNDCLVINKSCVKRRQSDSILHYKIINSFDIDKRYFIYSEDQQYQEYKYKNIVKPLKVKYIEDYYNIINSCKLFLGNLSSPTAIAYSLKKEMVCEFGDMDSDSYRGEIEFYDNISWFDDQKYYFSKSLSEIIKI